MVIGFQFVLGACILENMKYKIIQMHAFKLWLVQIMQQHIKEVKNLALDNDIVTFDMFLLPIDVWIIVVQVSTWTMDETHFQSYWHSCVDIRESWQYVLVIWSALNYWLEFFYSK